jgi:undecaprenyl-diphosphatase
MRIATNDQHVRPVTQPANHLTRPTTRIVVVAVGLIAVCVGIFVLIAEDLLEGGGLVSHDESVLVWFVDHRTPTLIRAAKVVSAVGGFVGLAVAGVGLAIVLVVRGWRCFLVVAPLVALVLASLASTAAKSYFGRERPPTSVRATTVALDGFPSGHATDAAAFFLAAAFVVALMIAATRRSRVLVVATGALLAGLVGVSRLVLAVHWLSDVVAGWALGSAIAIAVVIALWALTQNPSTAAETSVPQKHQ